MKNHKKLIIFTLLAVVLIAAATVWYVRYNQENDRKTAALLAVANQFKAPADWTLASETIHEAKPGCIDIKCPSVLREWSFAPVEFGNVSDLKSTALELGWKYDEEIGCDPQKLSEGFSSGCYLRGYVKGYNFTLIFRSSDSGLSKALLTVD